jgi:2-dehydro-3-deoxygalactonokinase
MSNPSEGAFVAVDWGTSSFRAWLISSDGRPLKESKSSEGMLHCAEVGFEPVLRAHIDKLGGASTLPVLICGMAGARQGWVEAPYLQTPTHLHALHEGAVRVPVDGEVFILPGVAQSNARHPDVMRGEETQLLGLTEPDFTGIVCMPGTHSKWVHLQGGQVMRFTTFMTGELFAVLSKNSILTHAIENSGSPTEVNPAYREAVAASLHNPIDLTASLFRLRAAQLLGFEDRVDGSARLSGLLIGTEIASALRHLDGLNHVRLVASGSLGDLYEAALVEAGLQVTRLDSEQASRQGLSKAAMNLWPH